MLAGLDRIWSGGAGNSSFGFVGSVLMTSSSSIGFIIMGSGIWFAARERCDRCGVGIAAAPENDEDDGEDGIAGELLLAN